MKPQETSRKPQGNLKETSGNLKKTVIKPGQTAVLNTHGSINQSGTLITSVFYTPRFSYRCLKTVICACRQRVAYRGGMRVRRCPWQGGYTGVWYREGIPGGLYRVHYPPTPAARSQ